MRHQMASKSRGLGQVEIMHAPGVMVCFHGNGLWIDTYLFTLAKNHTTATFVGNNLDSLVILILIPKIITPIEYQSQETSKDKS